MRSLARGILNLTAAAVRARCGQTTGRNLIFLDFTGGISPRRGKRGRGLLSGTQEAEGMGCYCEMSEGAGLIVRIRTVFLAFYFQINIRFAYCMHI